MKLYTKEGDAGFTSLLGRLRVRKDDARLEAAGMVDELNCLIGHASSEAGRVNHETIFEALKPVQGDLFIVGARLAALGSDKRPRPMNVDAICEMERRSPLCVWPRRTGPRRRSCSSPVTGSESTARTAPTPRSISTAAKRCGCVSGQATT